MKIEALFKMRNEITHMQERLCALREITLSMPRLDGMPKASRISDRTAKIAVKIADAESTIQTLQSQLPAVEAALMASIEKLPVSEKVKSVLILRFICCLPYAAISEKMAYTQRTIYKIAKRGRTAYKTKYGK